MVLYQNYCYATVQDAASVEISNGVIAYSNYLASPKSFELVNETTINMTYALSNSYTSVLERTYPLCTQLGVFRTYSGLTYESLVELLGLVIGLWVLGFGIRSVKSSLGVR